MERPEINIIKESLPFIGKRIAKGTITHLIEYIEYLEDCKKSDKRWECPVCKSKGFEPSITGKGCTFCDGTEGGNPPKEIK
jgi:hypothetical protein